MLALHPGRRLVVTAAQQTAGRGRLGRVWHAPRGGAWFSLVWPTKRGVDYAAVPLRVGAVLRDLIAGVTPEPVTVKPPNDVLIAGKKVAGVLCEQEHEAQAIIVGVGINANFDVSQLPRDLHLPAVALVGVEVDSLIAESLGLITASLTQYEQQHESASQ